MEGCERDTAGRPLAVRATPIRTSARRLVWASGEAYGYTEAQAIRVAGLADRGPASERAYLDRLRGPMGQAIEYERQGSCCAFETPRGIGGIGLLDMYEVTYEGLDEPVMLYLNMYDPPEGDLKAPAGFKLMK
ncbi:MAG: hypothetical protein AAFQ43_03225 [Bacteroidota bacterium]